MTSDMTTDRAVHVAAFRPTFHAALFGAVWWEHDGYAYTNVAPIEPTVCHFRAPMCGGEIQVNSVDGTAWSDAGMSVQDWSFIGYDASDAEYDPVPMYRTQTTFAHSGVVGYPLARF